MTARLSNLPPTRIEKLETFLIERWCLLRIHCEDGTVGTDEAGVHGWPRPTAAMIDDSGTVPVPNVSTITDTGLATPMAYAT